MDIYKNKIKKIKSSACVEIKEKEKEKAHSM